MRHRIDLSLSYVITVVVLTNLAINTSHDYLAAASSCKGQSDPLVLRMTCLPTIHVG